MLDFVENSTYRHERTKCIKEHGLRELVNTCVLTGSVLFKVDHHKSDIDFIVSPEQILELNTFSDHLILSCDDSYEPNDTWESFRIAGTDINLIVCYTDLWYKVWVHTTYVFDNMCQVPEFKELIRNKEIRKRLFGQLNQQFERIQYECK